MMGTSPTTGLICPTPAAWTKSSNHLAIPFGRLIHIYDFNGSTPTRSAISDAHQAPITTVLSPSPMQFVTSSTDATVRFWDVLDGECLRTVDLAHPVHAMCQPSDKALLCLTTSSLVYQPLDSQPHHTILSNLPLSSSSLRIASSESGKLVAIIANKSLHLTSLTPTNSPTPHTIIHFSKPLTALAVSSNASFLAVGDTDGRIFLVSNPSVELMASSEVRAIRFYTMSPTIQHWHASSVMSLQFAHDDSVLISGGHESVLVTWPVTAHSIGKKTFLPRLPAPILALSASPNHSFYAVSHFNNSVSILSQASNSLHAQIRGISTNVLVGEQGAYVDTTPDRRMTVCNDQTAPSLFIAKDTSHVQIFDPIRGHHLGEINVIPVNATSIPKKQADQRLSATYVELIALHPLGDTLATVDVTKRCVGSAKKSTSRSETVRTMRLWQRGYDSTWNLSAVIVNPHGEEQSVLSMKFHPLYQVLVTTGSDRTFKFWTAVNPRKKQRFMKATVSWRCDIVRQYREQVCKCSSFCSDGSMLALGSGSMVTLWQFENLSRDDDNASKASVDLLSESSVDVQFLQSLVHAPVNEDVESVEYVMCGVPLFIAATVNGVYAWNAMTQGIWWSFAVGCDPRTLTVDLRRGRFALAVQVAALVSGGDESGEMEIGHGDSHKDDGMQHTKCKNEEINHNDVDMEGRSGEGTLGGDNEGTSEDEGCSDGSDSDSVRENSNIPKAVGREGTGSGDRDLQLEKRKASDKAAQLKNNSSKRRERANAETKRKPTSKASNIPKTRQPKTTHSTSTDYAVAVFDANSPTPVRVNRMAPGIQVEALSFVNTDGTGSKLGNDRSALICIDNDMEVSVMKSDGEVDEFSLVSDEPLVQSQKAGEDGVNSLGKLDVLLGAGWQDEKESGALEGSNVRHPVAIGRGQLGQVFDEHFTGPIHAQAPVTTQAVSFLKSILHLQREQKADITQDAITHSNEAPEEWSAERDTAAVVSAQADEKLTQEANKMNAKDISKFCSRLISKATEIKK